MIQRALSEAGVKSNQVSYVESHGTGTPLGDPVEIEGLKGPTESYVNKIPRYRHLKQVAR